jgi:Spy/CpxP family protein refolding chaperone
MVIFGCGVITGAILMKTEVPTPAAADVVAPLRPSNSTNEPPPLGQFQKPEFLRRMQKQLDLTPSQTEEITKAMKASQERNRPLWDQISPQLRQEMKRLREEIRVFLTPEQQRKYDELLKARARKGEGAGAALGRPPRIPPGNPAPTNTP